MLATLKYILWFIDVDCVCDPLRAFDLPRSAGELCLSVVLQARHRGGDHGSFAFSQARHERFREGKVFRRAFDRIAAGLVGGKGFAVDANLIQADPDKQRSVAGQDWRRDPDPQGSNRGEGVSVHPRHTAWGAASEVVPKFVSPSDPAAHRSARGPASFAYSDSYLIDVKFGVIVGGRLRPAPRHIS